MFLQGGFMEKSSADPDVYVLPIINRNEFRPSDALRVVRGKLGVPEWEAVLVVFLDILRIHDAWCGIEEQRFFRILAQRHPTGSHMADLLAVQQMKEDGLFEVPIKYKGRFTYWLNNFEPRVICPTRMLIRRLRAPEPILS